MCRLVRLTIRRATPCVAMRTRVWRARRRRCSFLFNIIRSLLLLRFLDRDLLVRVADPLALVGLGRTDGTNLGGDLADALAVGPLDDDFRRARRLHGDARGHVLVDGVREA